MKALRLAYSFQTHCLRWAMLGLVACGHDLGPDAGGPAQPSRDGGDSNQLVTSPATDANATVSAGAKVVLDIDSSTPPNTAELAATAKVGEPLVARLVTVGGIIYWHITAAALGDPTIVSSEWSGRPADGVFSSVYTWQTMGLAAGTYDILATYDDVVNHTTATITVQVTLTVG